MPCVCFDTESNYYWNGLGGYLDDPGIALSVFRGKIFDFHAATAFVCETGEHTDFTCHEELFEFFPGPENWSASTEGRAT